MYGHKQFIGKVVLSFRLSERMPTHNFYLRLRKALDWEFVREQTHLVYSHTWQPLLDPVPLFNLLLVRHLKILSVTTV
jgi:hypothetical protein